MRYAICFIIISWFTCGFAHAQYYYQDIYNAINTMKEHHKDVQNGVHYIRIKSFDGNQSLNKHFHCVKEFSEDFRQVITKTNSFQTGKSVIISFFDDSGRIIHTTDSTNMSVNDTYYYYDKNRIRQIDSLRFISSAIKNKDTFRYAESHIYQYDAKGRLQKMLRKKNDLLYSTVTFTTDSTGRVIKESEKGQYDTAPPVYYKYNAMNQPTDIFHFNQARQKMVPDYLFDYDNQSRLSEKTTVTMNTNSYLLWKYFYDEKGLISKEECYGKKQALLGVLRFEYSF